jgi:hypothetical protein
LREREMEEKWRELGRQTNINKSQEKRKREKERKKKQIKKESLLNSLFIN